MKHTLTLIMLFIAVVSWGQNNDTSKITWIGYKYALQNVPFTKLQTSDLNIKWGDITSYSVSNHGRTIVNITKDMIYVIDDSSRIICTIKYNGQLQWSSYYDSFKHYTPLLFK